MPNEKLKIEALKGWLKQYGFPKPKKSHDVVYEEKPKLSSKSLEKLKNKYA
jgi:hypothetical protein